MLEVRLEAHRDKIDIVERGSRSAVELKYVKSPAARLSPSILHVSCRKTAASRRLLDGSSVRHNVASVHHDARRASRGIQSQNSLDHHVHGGYAENHEHDLRHAFSAGTSFTEQDGT